MNDMKQDSPAVSKQFDTAKMLRKLKEHLPLILCALAALLAFSLCIYFILGPAEGYFHSDCTDSILWAQAAYDSGKVFDPDYNYAALLPFGASLWLIPLISVFGVTMQTHVIGMVIFAFLFLASIIVLCRKMKWSYARTFGTVALLFLILSSSEKLREIMWNHVIYYSLGLLLYFFLLALTFYALEVLDKRDRNPYLRLLPLAGLLIFTALNATNGSQMLVLTVLPICAGVLIERFFDRETPLFSKKNIAPGLLIFVMAIGVLIGSMILGNLTEGIYSGYATGSSTYSPVKEWPQNLDNFFVNWFTLLGVDVADSDSLFSLDSIVNLLRVGVGILLLVVPLIAICRYRKIENYYTRVLLIGHITLLAFLFFGCVCGELVNANWRLTPALGSSVITTVAVLSELWKFRKTAICAARCGVLVIVALAILASHNAKLIADMPFDYGRDNTLHVLTERLEEENLTYGYATFWQSQAITLLSDSEVQTREIRVEEKHDPVLYTDHYQSNLKWYEDQEGVEEYFILLKSSELTKLKDTDQWQELLERCFVRSFTCKGYYIFVFSENIFEPYMVE